MKLIILLFVLSLSACKAKLDDRRFEFYQQEKQHLVSNIIDNNVSMQMSYLPSFALPKSASGSASDSSSSFYYFRLQIKSQISGQRSNEWMTAAYYDLERLFTVQTAGGNKMPVFVQNVIKGNSNDLEYILVFNKTDFDTSTDKIIVQYDDRLLTGKSHQFTLSSKAIILLEKLS